MQRHETAILFSGGLDSTAAAILMPEAHLVRVGTGARYDHVESYRAQKVADALGRPMLHDKESLNLAASEDANALIPGRNALLTIIAGRYAKNLVLVSVAGDGTHATDKDVEFADLMTTLLRKLYGSGSLSLPFRSYSKIELVNLARRRNLGAFNAAVPHVWSCYAGTDPTGLHCGRCKACVRLAAALYTTVIDPPRAAPLRIPQFQEDPFTLPFAEYAAIFEGRGSEEAIARQTYRHAERQRS